MRASKAARLRAYYEGEFFEFESTRGYLDDIFTSSRLKAVWEALPPGPYRRPWLDVGCGFGYGLARLHSLHASPCVGVDISMRFLEAARSIACGGCSLCQADILSLPFESGVFQGVLALEVIEHALDVSAAIDELCRVSGDFLFLSFPTDHDWLYSKLGIVLNPYVGLSFEDALHDHVGHISVPTLHFVVERLSRNGFAIEQLKSLYSVVPPPFKLGFHYPDVKRIWQILYRWFVAVDHWLGRFPPLRGRGLSVVVVARRSV